MYTSHIKVIQIAYVLNSHVSELLMEMSQKKSNMYNRVVVIFYVQIIRTLSPNFLKLPQKQIFVEFDVNCSFLVPHWG